MPPPQHDRQIRQPRGFLGVLFWLIQFWAAGTSGQVNVLMSQYDYERTGANLSEHILRPSNVNPAQFGRLFFREVDDSIYAEPLIASNISINGKRRNVLFVATMGNTVYAFDADDPTRARPLWRVSLGNPADGDTWIGPVHFGILSTPFLDLPSETLYVVSKNKNGADTGLWVHALDMSSGKSKINSPQRLYFPFRDGATRINVSESIQRPGLLVVGDTLVVAVASILPGEEQEGFVQSFNARNLKQRLASFQVTPTGLKGGIWQAGRGLAADGDGNVYAATAGGTFDGETNFGSSILKFSAKNLALADWFTPSNHEFLYHNNIDPSANGVTLIPHSPYLFAGGKEGVIYLLDRKDMGRLETPGHGPVQRFQASNGCGRKDCAQNLGTAFWSRQTEGMLYVWDRGDTLRAYRYRDNRFETAPLAVSTIRPVVSGGPSVSADGADLSSGIVWAVTASQEPGGPQVQGTLRAFLASDISRELYNSGANLARDQMGGFVKFATPVVANGKVYVPTQSNRIAVYGSLPAGGK